MSFFLLSKGNFLPYDFEYIHEESGEDRLDKTKPGALSFETWQEVLKKKGHNVKEIFAIEVMEKSIFSIESKTLVKEAYKLMLKKGIRHLPIIDSGKIVGVLSDRDLIKTLERGAFDFLKVNEIMSTIVILAHEETALAHIANVMLKEKVSFLPIINLDKKLTGVLTTSNVLESVVKNPFLIQKK